MEKILEIGWNKLLPTLIKTLEIVLSFWNWLKPFLLTFFQFIAQSFFSVKSFLGNISGFLITLFEKNYATYWPMISAFAEASPLGASLIALSMLLLLIFWIYIFKYAQKNEFEKPRLWKNLILWLGPFGALLYYFKRKRGLEIQQAKREKLRMSFFSPMTRSKKSFGKKS